MGSSARQADTPTTHTRRPRMNGNSTIWTIVGVLLIVALLVWLFNVFA